MVQPHVEFVEIGDVSVTDDTGTGWAGTGIIIPETDPEVLIAQIANFKTSPFQAERLFDLDQADAGTTRIDSASLPLNEIGVSGFGAHGWYLGLDGDSELLIATPANQRPTQVTVWYLQAVDIAAADLQEAAQARLLPTPTEATRGGFVRQSEDGETYEVYTEGDPPDPDVYTPRFTTLDRVIRALRVSRTGQWATGGDLQADVLNMIAAAESQIVAWCSDSFDVAAADAADRTIQCEGAGILLTPPFAEEPDSVSYLSDRSDTAGSALEGTRWWPVTEPTDQEPGRHLEGSFARGAWYRVNARWGWPAIPHQVRQAAELLSARLAHRQISPLGLVGGDAPMYVSRHDTDVRALLAPFMSASLV